MDTKAWAASVFGRLPYFNPMMMVNTSETCATTRLIQCRYLGISMNDVSRKFQQDPDDVPDLSKDEFLGRRKVLQQVGKWCQDMKGKGGREEWTPILYRYEIVKTSAKRQRDWGHLIFTDMTTTRFLLVMIFPSTCNCGNFSHHDYDAMTKYQADRFMSLLTALHHDEGKPNWIHATYTTPKQAYTLDPVFSSSPSSPSDAQKKLNNGTFPPIFHITPDTFVPSLLSSDLEKIDNILAQQREGQSIPASVRAKVVGGKESRPDVSSTWKQKNPRQCAHCEEIKEKDLMLCSRCKLVHYCGRECQQMAWPSHKLVCKKA